VLSEVHIEPSRDVKVPKINNFLICLALFLLALFPRAYDLSRFVTADEAKWVYRSAQFSAALLRGDFSATSVNLTPAVTTTWLGSLGLTVYYHFNQAIINLPFTDWLTSLPEFRTEMPLLVAARWPIVIFTSLSMIVIYLVAHRLLNRTLAFIAAAFIALDPHTVALSRILGHDALVAIFMSISILLLLLAARHKQAGRGASRRLREQGSGISSAPVSEASLPRSPAQFASSNLALILSAIAAGLAMLSKSPAFFLVPFTGLVVMGHMWAGNRSLYFWIKQFLVWIAVVYLTFVLFWPAAWVDPVGQPWAVIENAFLSATDRAEANAENYWLVPNLGPLYYLVNGSFKLSPLVMIGLGLAIIPLPTSISLASTNLLTSTPPLPRPPAPPLPRSPLLWLLAFALLFTIFMTLGGKRSPRYILPVFPPLTLLAAYGWLKLYRVISGRWQVANGTARPQSEVRFKIRFGHALLQPIKQFLRLTHYAPRTTLAILLTLAAGLLLYPYAPYYFTYFNPLLGGAYSAPHVVKVGWGEGLDQVGRFLQREAGHSRVGTAYASTIAPFFKGNLSGVTGSGLDYVVLYSKQVQSGQPSPAFIRYFEQTRSLFSVKLNGIPYAEVYSGPALQPSLALTTNPDASSLPKPMGFRPLTPYGRIGQELEVDVVWPAGDSLPTLPVNVTLQPISALAVIDRASHSRDSAGNTLGTEEKDILAAGQGQVTHLVDDLTISRHRLKLPDDLERGQYALFVDGHPLGEVELRLFHRPTKIGAIADTLFDDQIALIGYQFTPTEDYIAVNIAWQAQKSRLPDYTVFVQLVDAETNERVAGVDTQPVKGEWPTSRWVEGEVIIDRHLVAVPYGLPPGFYKVIAGLYQPGTGRRLILNNGQDHWVLPWTFIWKQRL
jgi:hypothetical protein